MKTTLWTIMLLCAINNISAQVKSQVKESFELTSIAFRLAGAEEYINNYCCPLKLFEPKN